MDVGSSRSAANVVGLVQGALKTLVIDLAVLLEGHSIVRASLAMPLALYCMIHRPLARYPGHRTGRAPGGPLHRARASLSCPLCSTQTPGRAPGEPLHRARLPCCASCTVWLPDSSSHDAITSPAEGRDNIGGVRVTWHLFRHMLERAQRAHFVLTSMQFDGKWQDSFFVLPPHYKAAFRALHGLAEVGSTVPDIPCITHTTAGRAARAAAGHLPPGAPRPGSRRAPGPVQRQDHPQDPRPLGLGNARSPARSPTSRVGKRIPWCTNVVLSRGTVHVYMNKNAAA